jgi:hypothetical protein
MPSAAVSRREINRDHAVVYLSGVASLRKRDQDTLYKELINGRHHRSVRYNLRIVDDKNKFHCLRVFRNTFLNIMLIGKRRHAMLRETHFIPGANLNKNNVNSSATRSPELLNAFIKFIKEKGAR